MSTVKRTSDRRDMREACGSEVTSISSNRSFDAPPALKPMGLQEKSTTRNVRFNSRNTNARTPSTLEPLHRSSGRVPGPAAMLRRLPKSDGDINNTVRGRCPMGNEVDVDPVIRKAYSEYEQANYADCVERLESAMSKALTASGSVFIGRLYLRGISYLMLGEYDRSISDLTACINGETGKKMPRGYLAPVYFNRSVLYFALAQYDDALKDVSASIELAPHEAKYYSSRGNIYRRMARYSLAQDDYLFVKRLQSSNRPEGPHHTKDVNMIMKNCPLLAFAGLRLQNTQKGNLESIITKQRKFQDALSATQRSEEQINLLLKTSRLKKCLASFTDSELTQLWRQARYKSVLEDYCLFEKGSPANYFAIIWTGKVSVRLPKTMVEKHLQKRVIGEEVEVDSMNEGAYFGESCIEKDAVRAAACYSSESTELLILDSASFVESFQFCIKREADSKIRFLAGLPCFARWNCTMIRSISITCRDVVFPAQTTIIEQSAPVSGLFFIVSGVALIFRALRGESGCIHNVLVTRVSSGDVFGESLILHDGDHTLSCVSVIAETMLKAYRLDEIQIPALRNKWGLSEYDALKRMTAHVPDDRKLLQYHKDQERWRSAQKSVMAAFN